MKQIKIGASSRSYDALIGSGLLSGCGERIKAALPDADRVCIVTDDIVSPLYAMRVEAELKAAGLDCILHIIPHGESGKSGESFLALLNCLAQERFTRSDALAALGGGVVGDLTGFAAASYLRGVPYVQLPTTLLAAVDSSIGGKTAINLDCGKNLAGAFWQPRLVLCDTDVLDTLGSELFAEGCAEAIKYGVLGDAELFAHLCERGISFNPEYVIGRCVEIKRDFVGEDEFDNGPRRLLNLGHTVGHAIETLSGWRVSHGRAVAAGLAVVAKASESAGICDSVCVDRIFACLERFGLPQGCEYSPSELIEPMLSDKKRRGSVINLVVPECIGSCRVLPLNISDLEGFIGGAFI